MKRAAAPWYADGLRFACTRCGACCTGEGYVWVTPERIARIAGFLGLEPQAFAARYVRRVGDRLSLIEKPNTDCVFWQQDSGCTVYAVRPEQCRSFPFWPEHLESPAAWSELAAECPGIGEGPLHTIGEIRRRLPRTGEPTGD